MQYFNIALMPRLLEVAVGTDTADAIVDLLLPMAYAASGYSQSQVCMGSACEFGEIPKIG